MCTFTVTVAPAAASTGVCTLNGAPGVCGGAVSAGTYALGTALTAANTIQLQVTVTTIGSYTITTNTVNGFSFSATGNFAALGPQSVLLTGTGTPTAAGSFNFTATAGASTCTFSVVCTGTPPVVNNDYRPQTANTNYSGKTIIALIPYPPSNQILDTTFLQVSPNTISKNGNTYRIMEEKDNGITFDSILFRRNGAQYFELVRDDLFGYFDNYFSTDVMFLDTTISMGTTWTTPLGSNTVNGVTATGSVTCYIFYNSPVTLNGILYTNAIGVKCRYNATIGSLPAQEFLGRDIYYARGVGVIIDSYYPPIPGNPNAVGAAIKTFEANRTQVF
jgi:hypothetical protein